MFNTTSGFGPSGLLKPESHNNPFFLLRFKHFGISPFGTLETEVFKGFGGFYLGKKTMVSVEIS